MKLHKWSDIKNKNLSQDQIDKLELSVGLDLDKIETYMHVELTKLNAYLARLNKIHANIQEWKDLSMKPFSNRKRLEELEKTIGCATIQFLIESE